jgi:WD40 repeat protein
MITADLRLCSAQPGFAPTPAARRAAGTDSVFTEISIDGVPEFLSTIKLNQFMLSSLPDASKQSLPDEDESHRRHRVGVALTADGRRAVSASSDNTLKMWDLESGMCIATFRCDAYVLCCAVAQDIIVAGDAGGWVHFFGWRSSGSWTLISRTNFLTL